MLHVSCDRCNLPLNDGEGYQVNVMGRAIRISGAPFVQYAPNPHADEPFAGEICNGCYDLLHFYFQEKFREPRPAA